jgi:hypothetical protein
MKTNYWVHENERRDFSPLQVGSKRQSPLIDILEYIMSLYENISMRDDA